MFCVAHVALKRSRSHSLTAVCILYSSSHSYTHPWVCCTDLVVTHFHTPPHSSTSATSLCWPSELVATHFAHLALSSVALPHTMQYSPICKSIVRNMSGLARYRLVRHASHAVCKRMRTLTKVNISSHHSLSLFQPCSKHGFGSEVLVCTSSIPRGCKRMHALTIVFTYWRGRMSWVAVNISLSINSLIYHCSSFEISLVGEGACH